MSYKKILVMTDFSHHADYATEQAAELAKYYKAEISVLHVIYEDSGLSMFLSDGDYKHIRDSILDEVDVMFKNLEKRVPSLKGLKYDTIVKNGKPYVEGLKILEAGDYDLVVIGSHGHTSFENIIYGSTVEKIARNAKVSVLLTKLKGKK